MCDLPDTNFDRKISVRRPIYPRFSSLENLSVHTCGVHEIMQVPVEDNENKPPTEDENL